jgi:hypothetical protein
MLKIALTLAAACALTGCVSTGSTGGNGSFVAPTTRSDERIAICVGLTSVDPAAYGGWDGDCPGCDKDAEGMFGLMTRSGMETSLYLNSSSTWHNVAQAIYSAAGRLKPGGLLVVTISSHGGQVQDRNGDESDGFDETICLWDGSVVDDRMFELVKRLPPTIRLVMINDSCHSEGNFRSATRAVQKVVSLGYWGGKKPRTSRVAIRRASPSTCSILQMAGCSEGMVSYGGSSGGAWTSALLATEDSFGTIGLSWKDWFDFAAMMMPDKQKPTFVEFGPNPFSGNTMLK